MLGSVSRVHRGDGSRLAPPPGKAAGTDAPPPPPPRSAATVDAPMRTLRGWNAAMFLFHGALLATTLVAGNVDLRVPVYRTDIAFAAASTAAHAMCCREARARRRSAPVDGAGC